FHAVALGIGLGAKLGDHRAIHAHLSAADQFFRVAAGGYARAGDNFLQAFEHDSPIRRLCGATCEAPGEARGAPEKIPRATHKERERALGYKNFFMRQKRRDDQALLPLDDSTIALLLGAGGGLFCAAVFWRRLAE